MFTKGKWRITERIDQFNIDCGLLCVADVKKTFSNAEANARLIAAAPRMFEALEWISKVFHSEGSISEGDIGRVDRAIAAAKGE